MIAYLWRARWFIAGGILGVGIALAVGPPVVDSFWSWAVAAGWW